jgi:SAM-dependent methyltransferase
MSEPHEPGVSRETTYVLRRGGAGAERLHLLSRVKWPTTQTLLLRVGLKPGLRCLDVGCGIGEVTLGMAEMVGSEGEAVGVDCAEAFLWEADHEAKKRRLNARFRQVDAADLPDENAYDLVFARYLLTHLKDPVKGLAAMVRAARPGGLVVAEDIDFPGHVCHPPCAAFTRYLELYQAAVHHKGGDPCIGPRLPLLFLDAGLTDVQADIAQPTFLSGEGKTVASVTLEHIREPLVAAGLATDAEVRAVLAELVEHERNPRTVISIARTFQVWGRKPA